MFFNQKGEKTMSKNIDRIMIATGLLAGMAASPAFAATPFDGPYLGVQLGHSVHDIRMNETVTAPLTPSSSKIEGVSAPGAEGGLYAGWGTKMIPAIYGGVEGEYSLSNERFDASTTFAGGLSGQIKEKYNYGISGRLGWLPSPTSMLYVRAGWQRARLGYSVAMAGVSASQNKDHNGFRLGAGTEVALTSAWLLRLDYAYTWYDELKSSGSGFTDKLEPRHNVFRVGIAYQL